MSATTEAEAGDVSRRVRVILSQGVEPCQASELPFEIHRCEGMNLFADLSEGIWSNVLLVDLSLLTVSETAQLRALNGQLSNTFTIALSDEEDNLDCEQIIRMGFAGLLRRDETPATIIRAVQAVVSGQLWFPRQIISQVLSALLAQEGKSRLKSREMEILRLIGNGLNNQQIADALFISRETVRWHVRGLYSKLGIKDRRSAREYCQSIQRAWKGKPVQPETGEVSRQSGTAS